MIRFLAILIALALAAYVVVLRKQLSAAQQRGNMYHDIALRLDQRLATSNSAP